MCKLFLHYLVHRINHGQTAEVTLQNGPDFYKISLAIQAQASASARAW